MQNLIDILTFLRENIVVWALSLVATNLYTFYRTSRENRKKAFSYIDADKVIASKETVTISGLQLTYNGKNIKNLTISQFAVWNSGRGVIREEGDMARTQPLCIRSIGGSEILYARILRSTNPSNRFVLRDIGSEQVSVDFEFADEGDGILVQVWHTGTVDDLSVSGTVIEGEKNVKRAFVPWAKIRLLLLCMCILNLILSVPFLILVVFLNHFINIVVAFSLFVASFSLMVLWYSFRFNIPKPLRGYDKITDFTIEDETQGD